ncbi:MAG TPA: hypothetical protein P5556_03950 [Candidatus Gastranaerophilales bacterium]|nr:hypothetical protein [Candidatus Gastranaerophilales bacterium]
MDMSVWLVSFSFFCFVFFLFAFKKKENEETASIVFACWKDAVAKQSELSAFRKQVQHDTFSLVNQLIKNYIKNIIGLYLYLKNLQKLSFFFTMPVR